MIASRLGCSKPNELKWRARFEEAGIDGLEEVPRPRSPRQALALCVDEKTQIQALDRTQLLLSMRPGQPERRAPGTSP